MASSSRLKPGEKGKIIVSVDLKDKIGHLIKKVYVKTNDPKLSAITLVIKVAVIKPANN